MMINSPVSLTHRSESADDSLMSLAFGKQHSLLTAIISILPSTRMSLPAPIILLHNFLCKASRSLARITANQSVVKLFCRHKVGWADWNAISVISASSYCLSSVTNSTLQIDFSFAFARTMFDTNQPRQTSTTPRSMYDVFTEKGLIANNALQLFLI